MNHPRASTRRTLLENPDDSADTCGWSMSELPYSVVARVGRLVEGRVFRLGSVDDVDRYIQRLAEVVDGLPPGTQGVLCADHRPAELYTQAVTDRLVESFQRMNTKLERVAIVTGLRKHTLYMQLRRIVREAAYEPRQVFQIPEPAITHLMVALSPEELARARAFLGEIDDG